MKPFGMKKRSSTIHPHDKCGICCAEAPLKGQARMALKQELMKELNNVEGINSS